MALGVYWVGANGNTYTRDSINGVVDRGEWHAPSLSWDQQGYSRIDDPNAPAPQQDQVNAGDGSTIQAAVSAPTAPVGPTQAQLDPLMSSLNSLDEILANKNSQTKSEYQRALSGYNEQDALDRRNRDDNVFQNENTYTGNNQRALLNAANASSGLQGVLSSLGGLAGSGMNIVQKLVGLAANEDTGAARQTFEGNAGNINSAWEQAEREQRQRREDAESSYNNNLQNNKANVLSSRQSIYEKLAGLYGDDMAEGKTWASKAASLAAPIAETTRASVAPYQKASSLFSPAKLQEYLAGTQNLNVSTAGGGTGGGSTPINSPIYASERKKDQLAGVA